MELSSGALKYIYSIWIHDSSILRTVLPQDAPIDTLIHEAIRVLKKRRQASSMEKISQLIGKHGHQEEEVKCKVLELLDVGDLLKVCMNKC